MFIRQNDTGKIGVGPAVSISDGYTLVNTLDISTADSAKARLGDDSVVDLAAYTWAAVTGMDGYYDLTLQTGVTDTCGPLDILIEDVSLCLPIAMRFYVIEEEVYDALYATNAAGFQAGPTLAVPASTTKPPTNPTLEEALMYVYWRLIYGKVTVDGTEEVVFADDGSTELYTKAISDAGGTVTYAESAAGV
jgi:hypothetical protein